MRRLCLLFALLGLMSAILSGTGGAAEARALRRKAKGKTRANPAATSVLRPAAANRRGPTRTRGAERAAPPTSPDVIPRRLMIVGFDGRGAQIARAAAASALRDVASVRVVPLGAADAMRFGTAYGAEKTVGLAQRLNLTALLYGKITQARRAVHLELLLANGEDGRIVGEMTFDVRSPGALKASVRAELWSKLEPLIDQSASPGRNEAPGSPVAGTAPEAPTEGTPSAETPETDTTKPARVPRPVGRARELPGEKPGQPVGEATGRAPIARATPPGEEAQPGTEARKTGQEPEGATPGETETENEAPAAPTEETPTTTPRPPGAPAAHGDHEVAGGLEAEGPTAPPPAEATPACPTAEISPAGGVMARRFNYRDEQRGALRGYFLYRAPVGRVDGSLFPFAGPRCHGAAILGLHAAYEQMAPLNSQLADRELGTQGSGYEVDLALRFTLGRLTIQPAVGFLGRRYHVDGAVVPAADYRAAGGTLDVGWRGRILSFAAGGGAWHVLHVGDLQNADWFPRQTANAFAARVQLGLAANDWIDIVAGGAAEYETFSFTVDPNAANPNGVAAGAYDLYLQVTLAARIRLGAAPARRTQPAAP